MAAPRKFPASFLVEIGRVVTTWSYIEQEILIHASALASLETDGNPTEDLRSDFKRLREKWFRLCRAHMHTRTFNRIINPLNVRLAKASTIRGYMIHGRWSIIGPGRYKLEWWEQRDSLRHYSVPYTLDRLRSFSAVLMKLLADLYALADR
jgi:hypothetical protein